MPEPTEEPVLLEVLPVPPLRRGHPIVAWVVILAVVGFLVWAQARASARRAARAGTQANLTQVQLVGRMVVAQNNLPGRTERSLDSQLDALNTGPVAQRVRFIVLDGEVRGPANALAWMRDLDAKLREAGETLTPTQRHLHDLLVALYGDYERGRLDAPSLAPEDRDVLRRELGWFGDLALAPAGGPDPSAREDVLDAARHTLFVMVGAVGLALVLAVVGLVGLIVVVVLFAVGKLRGGLGWHWGTGGIYAETFAFWMVVFLVISFGAALLPLPPLTVLLAESGGILLSLVVALTWPVLRGIPWQQVRRDIGWIPGSGVALEILWGIASYLMALPLIAIGLLFTVWLTQLRSRPAAGDHPFRPEQGPYHPIEQFFTDLNWVHLLEILLLASVVAPIVEETMFRGVLYRHLRDATARFGWAVSVPVSAVIVSFIFAVIHPQGVLGVPLLMTLAFALALVREWRRSLLASMVVHALNNGAVLGFVALAMSG